MYPCQKPFYGYLGLFACFPNTTVLFNGVAVGLAVTSKGFEEMHPPCSLYTGLMVAKQNCFVLSNHSSRDCDKII